MIAFHSSLARVGVPNRGCALNTLFYGDNLAVLREQMGDESVDLIWLDPPFNSNAKYNILFKSPNGQQSESQFEAFEVTWHWNKRPDIPWVDTSAQKKAKREETGKQGSLL